MLTNNFRKFLAHIFAPVATYNTPQDAGGRFKLKDTNGVECFLGAYNNSNAPYELCFGEAGYTDTYLLSGEAGRTASQVSPSYRRFRIYCGTGSTEPTPEDYKLAAAVDLTSVVNDVMAGGKSTNLDSYTGTVATTVRNDTDAPITVTELGLLLQTAFGSTSASGGNPENGAYNNILMARELLETPIELPVGGIYTFQMTIDFSNI